MQENKARRNRDNENKQNDRSERDSFRSDDRRERSNDRSGNPRRDKFKKDSPRRDGSRPQRDGFKRDDSRRDDSRRDDSKREDFRRDDERRGNSRRDSFKKDRFKRDDSRRDGFKRNDSRRNNFRRDDERREESKRDDEISVKDEQTKEKSFTKDSFKRKVSFDVDNLPVKKNFFKDKDKLEMKSRAKTGRLEIAVGNLSANLNVMISAAHRAGRGLIYDFAELSKLNIRKKEDQSLVSEADIASETMLVTNLNKARPEFGFLLEEGGEKEGAANKKFIIDPLDGTSNFLHGIPHFAISIAMVVDDEVIAGVIYNPILDETFYAEKGNGAYILNGGTCKRIRVSETSKFIDSIIVTGIPNAKTPNHKAFGDTLLKVMSQVEGVRRTGSCALDMAYVAAGRFDGYFEMNMLKPWDFAAGLLLIREAGGYVCNFSGEEQDRQLFKKDNILACNDRLKANFKNMLLK